MHSYRERCRAIIVGKHSATTKDEAWLLMSGKASIKVYKGKNLARHPDKLKKL